VRNENVILRHFFLFSKDSSKELEELRSAFARAVEYLKQEVEERKLNHPIYRLLCSGYFSQEPFTKSIFLPRLQ